MLKTRIIPCLDVADGRVVKGVNFVDLVDAGDPDEIQAWIDDLPKRAAALDLAGDAETLARAMETAAVSALLEAKPKLDQAKVGLESRK
jgi:hypothetical protein